MDQYTVLFMPDDASKVRGFRVRARLLRRGLVAALAAAAILASISVDWVRLRRDASDVGRLRAESALQQQQLRVYAERMQGYVDKVQQVESQLAALREFDRKVRVIADLPPPQIAAEESATSATEPASDGAEPVSSVPPDGEAWARMADRAERLSSRATEQRSSFERLIELLRGKALRLASTPSIWPARGWLTSRYGYRISPFTGLRDFHGGIDVAAESGTEIVAPARGRVVLAGTQGALGNVVVLDHGFGIRTTFGHAQTLWVGTGQTVERGERIASLGSSGRSTGPHLHYAVERDGRLTNPLDYIVE